MKRKIYQTKAKISKRPANQKLIENFFVLEQAKTEVKINKTQILKSKEEDSNENKNLGNLIQSKNNSIKKQYETNSFKKNFFFLQNKKKLLESIKHRRPEISKDTTKEEQELIFPIIINTKLGKYQEQENDNIFYILDDILNNENKGNSNWVELFPILDKSGIIKLGIKENNNKNNNDVLGFVTKIISDKIYSLFSNSLISINIYLNRNGIRLIILIGLNYDKYSIKVNFIDEKKKLYKLFFKSDTVLGKDITKTLKDLQEQYSPPEFNKNQLLYSIYNIISEKNEKNNFNLINKTNINEDEQSNYEESTNNIANYLINNVEKILSLTLAYENLFDEKDKNYYNIFINLNSDEKLFLLKFLRRNNKWQNIYRLFDNEKNDLHNKIIENTDEIANSLFEKKLISNFTEVIGDFKNLNNDKLFEYLYYLSLNDLKEINIELNKICKNLNSSKDMNISLLSTYFEESFLNNPFYNLKGFLSLIDNDKIFFEKIRKEISEKITKFNLSEDYIKKTKSKKDGIFNSILPNAQNNKKNSNQYLYTYLNYSTFKSVQLSNGFLTGNKIKLINNIITSINKYLKGKSSSFMEDFMSKGKTDICNFNSKEKDLEKIFDKYNKSFFCINENLAKVMDKTSRLFFFYTDCTDLNDIGKEFYKIEKYELYSCHSKDPKNRIFKDKNLFNLYDDLYQIQNSLNIFSTFNSNEKNNYEFIIEILQPLIPVLLQLTNNQLYSQFFKDIIGNINSLNDKDIDKLNKKLTKNLIDNFESSFDLNNNIDFSKITFVDKYKPEYICAEMIYNYSFIDLEKSKNFKLANLFYLFLLNCFDNLFTLEQRGSIYHRIILIYNYHLKDKRKSIEILNICIEYDIKKHGIIKSGELVKIKEYYDKFKNQKVKSKSKKLKELYESLVDYSFKEITDDFDFKIISKEIKGESVYNPSTGRIQFKLTDDKFSETDTVEKFAKNYYLKNENLKGVKGENYIIPAIYFLLFWDEIFDDDVPLVFQSKYQSFPLDFFEKDFYINRKTKIDKKLDMINNYTKDELINHIRYKYEAKYGIKNPCILWENYLNNKNILMKISASFGSKKLVEIFKVILNHGLKYVKMGMPDLFLWKENICSKYKNFYYAEENSIKLVEVKSENDKLSIGQKFWIKTLYNMGINVEILYVK